MYDQNSKNEDVGDTVIHDGEGAIGERADGERADVESANSDDSGTEPQGGVEKEADDRIEPQGHDLVNMESSEKEVEETVEIAEKANQNNENENINDDKEDGDNDIQTAKKSGHSKKNRNVKSVIKTLKNKIETIQMNNGGNPNYLLIFEDNFSDVARTGPKTKTNRKMIVTAAGDLKEAFKCNTVGYNPEKMIVMKKGENLEQDFAFIDEYIKEKTKQVPAGSSPPTPMNNDKTLVDLLQMLTKSTSKKDSKKKRKNAK